MQSGPGAGPGRDVMVGPTRIVAARVFGTVFDDAHVTSYEDFSTEVDVASVRSVGLVGATQAPALLADLLAVPGTPPRVVLGLAEDYSGRDELLEALAAHPSLQPEGVIHLGGVLVVPLAPTDEVTDAVAAQALADLRQLRGPVPELPHAASAPPTTLRTPGRARRLVGRVLARLGSPAPS